MKFRYLWMAVSMLLVACGPSAKDKARIAEEKRIYCLDHQCEGDIPPKYNTQNEIALKLNGQWFVGPRSYFSTGINGAAFEWWEHKPLNPLQPRPSEAQRLVVQGHGYDISVEIFLRSTNIPPEPRGYKLIALAQASDWIESRQTLRPGLDVIKMKHVKGPRDYFIDHVTYYVATDLKGVDGLPPVATCSHGDQRNGGGSGFMWRPGIWAGIRTNQKHCADWPEIHQEVTRVLQLLREA